MTTVGTSARVGRLVGETCSVRGLVCFVTKKLLRFWKYAVMEFSSSRGKKSAQVNNMINPQGTTVGSLNPESLSHLSIPCLTDALVNDSV